MEKKDEVIQSNIAIRCAKAAIMLHALKSSLYRCGSKTPGNEQEEEEEMMMVRMRREIGDLKMALAKERVWRKQMRLCGLMELFLQVTLLLLLLTFFLLLIFLSP